MGTENKINSWYGWRPDKPDHRDFLFRTGPVIGTLPPITNLTAGFPDCYDQGELGSCTANAIAGILEFNERRQAEKNSATPSRLFIYYNERAMEGTIGEDSGAEIRDGIKSVVTLGAPAETIWPYSDKGTRFKSKPSKTAFAQALTHQALVYERVNQDLAHMKTCLASGFPFACGFSVYASFEGDEVAKTGIVPMPQKKEKMMGGHAVVCVGYNDTTQRFRMRNSWAKDWGQNGYFEMPYAYLSNSNLADDFWVIRKVE